MAENFSSSLPNDLDALWMPFTANRAFKKRPRLVARASGKHYYTPDGRPVLDGVAGLWCCNGGHNRETITEAIRKQAGELDFAPSFQFGHPRAFECATRLADLAPDGLTRVFFANSGSEAVDTALKIALAYHLKRGQGGRTRLIGREKAYHGVGFGGISVGGIVTNRKWFGTALGGTDHLPHTYNREAQAFSKGEPEWGAHLADELERLVALHDASTIAAVIVEPMSGAAGVLPPPKGYLQKLRALCDKHGILLIFDEVITGFGRMGHAFAAQRYGVVPDMITFAKGCTSGTVPMGGVLVSEAIHATFMDTGGPEHMVELFHGYTYSAHPLAVAACIATLDLYRDEGLFEKARLLEPHWTNAIMGLKDLGLVEDIRAVGMVAGIDLTPIKDTPGLRGYQALEHAFHEEGLMLRVAGDTLVLSPPLVIDEDDVASIAQKVRATVQALSV